MAGKLKKTQSTTVDTSQGDVRRSPRRQRANKEAYSNLGQDAASLLDVDEVNSLGGSVYDDNGTGDADKYSDDDGGQNDVAPGKKRGRPPGQKLPTRSLGVLSPSWSVYARGFP